MEKPHFPKPWLTPSEQINHLKSKGVRFELMSEVDAESYLKRNSNYFRIKSYKNGFAKVEEGARKGEFANLDFAMLVDLSIVDMLLRNQLLPMTLDIEHFCKVHFLQRVESNDEDGYEIVSDFLDSQDQKDGKDKITNRTRREIKAETQSPYCSYLVERHPDFDYPAWEFIEVISFGTFCHFYRFAAERFNDRFMKDEFYRLQGVRSLRNGCAHNQCILNDISAGKPRFKLDYTISKELAGISGIGKTQRRNKMKNKRFQQIVTALYMHSHRASEGVVFHRAKSLSNFTARMNKHLSYYGGNTEVSSAFSFLGKVIQTWYPLHR